MPIEFTRSVPLSVSDTAPHLRSQVRAEAVESPRELERLGVRSESDVFAPYVTFDDLGSLTARQSANYRFNRYDPLNGTVRVTQEVIKYDRDELIASVEGEPIPSQPLTESSTYGGQSANDSAATEEPAGNPEDSRSVEDLPIGGGEVTLDPDGSSSYHDGLEYNDLGK